MNEIRQGNEFKAWLVTLRDKTAIALISARIVRMEAGNFGDAKQVGDKVSELRIDYGPGYRVYYTRRGKTVYVLLCGGDKDSQQKDVRRAVKLAARLD
jgi:putative addiction module killer protein